MTSEAIFQSAKSLETSEESAIYTKITWKLIPFLFVCYTAAYLDRVNIGFAKVQMMSDLKFSDMVYGLGAGLFFLCDLRGPKQSLYGSCWCSPHAHENYDLVGHHLRSHGLRYDTDYVLRTKVPARCI
jgi:hypothetical protein